MKYPIHTLALAPVLWWQGRQVRRTVPVLPEPGGPREGSAGTGPVLRVLILGDSAAAGVGVSHQQQALSGQMAGVLKDHFQVRWKVVARTDATTSDTLHHLHKLGRQPFDAVVTSLGVNDVTSGLQVTTWIEQMNLLASLLFNQFATRHLLVSGLPPMHAFPALPEPLRSFLGDRARAFDTALAAWADMRPNVEHLPFRPGSSRLDVAADGFHPGAAVYAQWGRAAAQRLLAHARLRMGGIQAAASTPTNIR